MADQQKRWNPERISDEVRIILEKLAGQESFQVSIQASSAAAAINGIAQLMVKLAGNLQWPVEKLVAVLATVLLAPAEETEGEDHG